MKTRILTRSPFALFAFFVLAALAFGCLCPQRAIAGDEGATSLQAGSSALGAAPSLTTQAEGDLQFVGLEGASVAGNGSEGYTIYVRDGDSVEFTLKVKNSSSSVIEYVNMTSCSTYEGEGEETVSFRFPAYRFANPYIVPNYNGAATNATWEQGSELITNYIGHVYAGYTISAGNTASVIMDFDAGSLGTGTYDYSFTLGKQGEVYAAQLYSDGARYWESTGQNVVAAEYLTVPVKVVVYAQEGAALSVGTGAPNNITQITASKPYDFGTFDLSSGSLTGTKTFFAVNAGDEDVATDAHGNTTSIYANMELDDQTLAETPFSYVGTQTWARSDLHVKTDNTIENLSFDVAYDASSIIAGTYAGNLVVTTVPCSVSVNGGAASASGVYRLPFTITLVGDNPRLDARVTDLSATPGNGMVELAWTPASTADQGAYLVYRREGAETQTDPDALDWSKYTQVGSVNVAGNSSITFADGTAKNGTVYSYTVLTGGPYRGYAAKPASATPSSSVQTKLLAPMDGWNEYVSAYSDEGGVRVSWTMNSAYGGTSCDGAGMVDHFNVYRDGVLVRQVYQSAVGRTGAGTESDPYEYGWSTFVPVPEYYVNYRWKVSAVSSTGVEGYLSADAPYGEDLVGGVSYERPIIVGHRATYVSGEGLELSINHYVGLNHYGAELSFWRAEGTTAPNTSASPLATVQSEVDSYSSGRAPDFTDTGVSANKTYTYTVRATDYEENVSEDYTFTVYTKSGRDYSTDVSWSVAGGATPTLKFYVPDSGAVARVYRNDTLVRTINYNNGDYQTYQDTPTVDGTYLYRVDFYYATGQVTTTGRTYTFVRDSNAAANMLQPPATPTLAGRLSGEDVVLTWTPSAEGGAPDGYYIYRKDDGAFVNGRYSYYRQSGHYGNWYETTWGNDRYLVIGNPSVNVLVDTKDSRNYNGVNATDGYLPGIRWWDSSEGVAPTHEWYICAYNEAGVSAPSQVVSFSAQGADAYNKPILPENVDSLVPGTPVIGDVWVDWSDDSDAWRWDTVIGGYVRAAWDDSNPGGGIDRWSVAVKGTVYHQSTAVNTVVNYADALVNPTLKQGGIDLGGASVNALPQANSSGDYGRTVEVAVTAENSAGASDVATDSIVVRSLPRFYALPGNGKAVLRWTDLFNDTDTLVTGWEVWRKDPYGIWAKLNTSTAFEHAGTSLDYSGNDVAYYEYIDTGLMNGYAYEYKVVPICADGGDRPSVVREVTPKRTAATETPSAPTNLRASVINGEISLSWNPPAAGEKPAYYEVLYEYTYNDKTYWTSPIGSSISGDSTSAVWKPDSAGTYRFFVYGYSYIDDERVPDFISSSDIEGFDGMTEDQQLSAQYPTRTEVVSVEVTQAQIGEQATSAPGQLVVTATSGDHQVTLSWPAVNGATYYTVERQNNDYPKMANATIAVVAGQGSYSFTDVDAEPGVTYRYLVTARNHAPNHNATYTDVYAKATGKTRDQVAAERVEALIEALPGPDTVGLTDAARVAEVKELYDSLTAKQKTLVDDVLVQKLFDDIEALENLQAAAEYQEQIDAVQELIDALPSPVTLEDKPQVTAAHASMDQLPAIAQRLVNATKLLDAEATITALEKAAVDEAAAAPVRTLLEALPLVDDVTLDNENQIAEARTAFDALTPDQQALISSELKQRLADDGARLAQLKKIAEDAAAAAPVIAAIAALPDPEDLTLDDRDEVDAALRAYDELTGDQQALVDAADEGSNTDKLRAAAARVENLRIDLSEPFGSMTLSATSFTYNGADCRPGVVVEVGGKMLLADRDYEVHYANNRNAGTAMVTIFGIGDYKGQITRSFTIKKAANPLSVKAKAVKAKYKKVKKKTQKLAALTVGGAQGKLGYKIVKIKTKKKLAKQAKKKIKLAAGGKLALKKKLKKGTYKVTVRVSAAGNGNYLPASRDVTVKVRVK